MEDRRILQEAKEWWENMPFKKLIPLAAKYGVEKYLTISDGQLLHVYHSEHPSTVEPDQVPDIGKMVENPEAVEREKLSPEIRRGYISMIDENKVYPVSYIIDNRGNKIYGLQQLKGGDLTENQIIELFDAGFLVVEPDKGNDDLLGGLFRSLNRIANKNPEVLLRCDFERLDAVKKHNAGTSSKDFQIVQSANGNEVEEAAKFSFGEPEQETLDKIAYLLPINNSQAIRVLEQYAHYKVAQSQSTQRIKELEEGLDKIKSELREKYYTTQGGDDYDPYRDGVSDGANLAIVLINKLLPSLNK